MKEKIDAERGSTSRVSRRAFLSTAALLGTGGAARLASAAGAGTTIETATLDAAADWRTVELDATYDDPAVFALPLARTDRPASPRLRNVGGSSFDLRVERWDEANDASHSAGVGCLALEAGATALADGTPVEAGFVETDHGWTRARFESDFSTAPIVLTQTQTARGSDPVVTRNHRPATDGVSIRLQEGESGRWHTVERIGYFAVEPGTGEAEGAAYEAGTVSGVDSAWTTISFDRTYDDPVFLADFQSSYGWNPCTLRYRNLTGSSVEVLAEEERTGDAETTHTGERVGYVVFDGGRTDSAAAAEPQTTRRVVGYYGGWTRYDDYLPSDVPLDSITHLNYAFLDVESDGTVTYADEAQDRRNLESFRDRKREHPETRMLLSIGGWTLSDSFSDAALTAERRERFARTAVEMMREYDFDGVDVDWEYPTGGGAAGNASRSGDPRRFTLLLRALRRELDRAGERDGAEYELSAAVSATPNKVDPLEVEKLARHLDYANVMTYDYAGTWRDLTAFNSPLHATSEAPDSTAALTVERGMEHWVEQGMAPDQLNLGLPFYGRSFAGVPNENDGLYRPMSGEARFGLQGYDYIRRNLVSDSSYRSHWQGEAKVPWLYSPDERVFVTYDDPRSIGAKATHAAESGYGGVMIWELSHDREERLLGAIHEAF